ncbi:MAG: (2Fe-2S) ferredoxin domain-containing protein [Spirochaetales bacterium]|nr:(2Fe-2S) ferredoxin domain-containing protein [Spirochaetales bacterium]
MAKMTLEELKELRQKKKKELNKREVGNKEMQIIVGMGTCGIAAGAKDTLDSFISTLDEKDIDTVTVTQTGCMGLCYVEPTVEVIVPGMPNVIYGKVDADVAKKIVNEHIINKHMVNEHVFDRPSADIIDNGGK